MRKSMLGDQTLPDCDYRPLALQNENLRNKRFDRLKARIIELEPEMTKAVQIGRSVISFTVKPYIPQPAAAP